MMFESFVIAVVVTILLHMIQKYFNENKNQ